MGGEEGQSRDLEPETTTHSSWNSDRCVKNGEAFPWQINATGDIKHLRIRVRSARKQTHLLAQPGDEGFPSRLAPDSNGQGIVPHASD